MGHAVRRRLRQLPYPTAGAFSDAQVNRVLLLFFKKEQDFFLKKEAKTFYPFAS
jgi:hypothetical protein